MPLRDLMALLLSSCVTFALLGSVREMQCLIGERFVAVCARCSQAIQLPFAADVQDDGAGVPADSGVLGAEGGLDSSAAPSALYALCSAASSK